MGVAQITSGGVAICYVLPVLWMTSCFHTMGLMGGWTGTPLCSMLEPVDVAAGWAWAAAAHWLAGLAGRFAGAHQLGWALAIWRLLLLELRNRENMPLSPQHREYDIHTRLTALSVASWCNK